MYHASVPQPHQPASLRAAQVDEVCVQYQGGGIVWQTPLVAQIAVARGQATPVAGPSKKKK